MRASARASLPFAMVLALAACREEKADRPEVPATAPLGAPIAMPASAEPPPSPPPSAPALPFAVRTSDPATAPQLTLGFHAIESGWRWTEQKFAVKLGVPAAARAKGATLRLEFALPKEEVAALRSVKVQGSLGAASVTRTFSEAGSHRLELEVPPSELGADAVTAEFTTDRPFLPGGKDLRALGVIALAVELATR